MRGSTVRVPPHGLLSPHSSLLTTHSLKRLAQPPFNCHSVNILHADAILHAGHGGKEVNEFRFRLRVGSGVSVVEERW